MYLSPRYLANIENKGQHPSLQVFFEFVTRYNISVDQFLFSDEKADKTTERRQLDALVDSLDSKGLKIVTATAKGIQEVHSLCAVSVHYIYEALYRLFLK